MRNAFIFTFAISFLFGNAASAAESVDQKLSATTICGEILPGERISEEGTGRVLDLKVPFAKPFDIPAAGKACLSVEMEAENQIRLILDVTRS